MNWRRTFLVNAAAFALAKSGALSAQPKVAPVLIGWLLVTSRETNGHYLTAFREGMAELGWKEGTQYVIEERWANGQNDRLPLLAAELAAKQPALIVAAPSDAVAAAVRAAPRMSIVCANGSDPVAAGFASTLARPGGMVTGLSNVATDITVKHAQLLLEAVPKVKRIGFLADDNNLNRTKLIEAAERSVADLKLEGRFAHVTRAGDIEPALARLAKDGVQALVVFSTPMLSNERRHIIRLALAQRWAMIGGSREYAEEGALLSYGANFTSNYRRAAWYVDRILKGAKPGELPFEQPNTIELMINGRTAKALGIAIPRSLLIRADKVIQ